MPLDLPTITLSPSENDFQNKNGVMRSNSSLLKRENSKNSNHSKNSDCNEPSGLSVESGSASKGSSIKSFSQSAQAALKKMPKNILNVVTKSNTHSNAPFETSDIIIDEIHIIKLLYPRYIIHKEHVSETFNDTVLTSTAERRCAKIRNTLKEISAPTSELHLKQRKRILPNGAQITYDWSIPGSNILEWCIKTQGKAKEEAISYLDICVQYGYLISTEFDLSFNESVLYLLQMPGMFPNIKFSPTEEEYVAYLIRRDQFADPQLNDVEYSRFNYFRENKKKSKWAEYMKLVDSQLWALDKLSCEDRRRFNCCEFGFWKFYCPDGNNQIEIDIYADKEKKISTTEDMREESLVGEEKLAYWNAKVNYLANRNNKGYKSISFSSNRLIEHVEIFEFIDPMISREKGKADVHSNPWLKEGDEKAWKQEKKVVSVYDVRIWVNSFSSLLDHSVGLSLFREYCLKEHSNENLEFNLAVQKLEEYSTNAEYIENAKMVYDLFVAKGSEKEINLPSHILKELGVHFSTKEIKDLPNDVFSKAQDHIFNLMKSDTFVKFIASDLLDKFYSKQVKDKSKLTANSPVALKILHTANSNKNSPDSRRGSGY